MTRKAVTTTLSVAIMTVALLMQPLTSEALLTEVDLFSPGDKLITRDTATGLDWLDLTETTNLSVNDILADVGGWDTLGFTHATTNQVAILFLNSGPGVTLLSGFHTVNLQPALFLLGLVGVTDLSPELNAFGRGWAGVGEAGAGNVYAPRVSVDNSGLPITTGALRGEFLVLGNVVDTSFRGPQIGSWLIRPSTAANPVPGPSTMLLLATGFIGLGFMRRRREAV